MIRLERRALFISKLHVWSWRSLSRRVRTWRSVRKLSAPRLERQSHATVQHRIQVQRRTKLREDETLKMPERGTVGHRVHSHAEVLPHPFAQPPLALGVESSQAHGF